jgi:hypothetical protein
MNSLGIRRNIVDLPGQERLIGSPLLCDQIYNKPCMELPVDIFWTAQNQ